MLPVLWVLAALVLAAPARAQVLRVEMLTETYGYRFCQIAYRTSMPCETRVALTDSIHECLVRPQEPGPDRDHKLLLPLAAGRELSYAIVLPDGSRLAPRRLQAATTKEGAVTLRQEPSPGGGLDILASTAADAWWTLKLRRGGHEETYDGGGQRAPTARFGLAKLGPDDEIASAVVTARSVDAQQMAGIGPILGNRRLAAAFATAVESLGVDALLGLACDRQASRATLERGFHERAARCGLAPLLASAATRAEAVCLDDSLDAARARVPFSYALSRLGGIDWMARLRGWPAVTRVEQMAGSLFQLSWPAKPPPGAHSLYKIKLREPHPLAFWPGNVGGGAVSASFARLTDLPSLERLADVLAQKTHPFLLVVAANNQVQLALWMELDIPRAWIGPPDGRVTLYLNSCDVEPTAVMNVRINDQVMLPIRNPPESYHGSIGLGVTPETFEAVLKKRANWMAVTTSARLWKPGKNSIVITAEPLSLKRLTFTFMFVDEIRFGRAE